MARRSKTPAKVAPPSHPKKSSAKAAAAEAEKPGRVEQVRQVWKMTREQDPRAIPIILGPAVLVLAVLVVVGILIGHPIIFSIFAVLTATITGTSIFGRRATKTMYAQVEGRPGAAAAVLQGMRGDWRVTPAVGFTRNQELVHRAIGRPGVVLVGEGSSTSAIKQLMVDQKRRIGRVAPETPIYDLIIGEGEDRVPIRKLQNHMVKLPRNLKKTEINGVEGRMKALGGASVPLPKGPIPQRMPRGKMR
jgi:xanthosine utilization system XapX-like protein